MNVAVHMIVGQNAEPFLAAAITSVEWADYYSVVNTAPGTAEGQAHRDVVRDLVPPDKLRYAEYDPGDPLAFSFSDARNLGLSLIDDDGDTSVFWVDADEVHYPDFAWMCHKHLDEGADTIVARFHHLMVFKDRVQYVERRRLVFPRRGAQFAGRVHEQLIVESRWPVESGYTYVHYGYCKPQREVWQRWARYAELQGMPGHEDRLNPDRILDDRVKVALPFEQEHPPAVRRILESYPACPWPPGTGPDAPPADKVGLILLTYNDADLLRDMLPSLSNTEGVDFELYALDLGSTDGSFDLLKSQLSADDTVEQAGELLPLTVALNRGLEHFRHREDIQAIGWVHPDMRFDHPDWLQGLAGELAEHPLLGKVCAANTRDPLPEGPVEAHEQCYLIRRSVVNVVGLFDEQFEGIGGYEDFDYNRRIMAHNGYRVMVTPRAKVYHAGMGTRSRRDTDAEQRRNAERYAAKHGTYDAPV